MSRLEPLAGFDAGTALALTGHLVAGLALGLVFFTLLRRAIDWHLAGRRILPAAGLHVLRWAGAALAFWLAAQGGALPLLAVLAGFTVARFVLPALPLNRFRLPARGEADGDR